MGFYIAICNISLSRWENRRCGEISPHNASKWLTPAFESSGVPSDTRRVELPRAAPNGGAQRRSRQQRTCSGKLTTAKLRPVEDSFDRMSDSHGSGPCPGIVRADQSAPTAHPTTGVPASSHTPGPSPAEYRVRTATTAVLSVPRHRQALPGGSSALQEPRERKPAGDAPSARLRSSREINGETVINSILRYRIGTRG